MTHIERDLGKVFDTGFRRADKRVGQQVIAEDIAKVLRGGEAKRAVGLRGDAPFRSGGDAACGADRV